MKQEVQRAKVRYLEPLDGAETYSAKMIFDALGSYLLDEYSVILRLQRYQPNVSRIAFIIIGVLILLGKF